MTNPVILLGTQSNGETLPVQVDDTGRLVAEGLEGPPGPQGDAFTYEDFTPEQLEGLQGPPGPPGPDDLKPYGPEYSYLIIQNGKPTWVSDGSEPEPPEPTDPVMLIDKRDQPPSNVVDFGPYSDEGYYTDTPSTWDAFARGLDVWQTPEAKTAGIGGQGENGNNLAMPYTFNLTGGFDKVLELDISWHVGCLPSAVGLWLSEVRLKVTTDNQDLTTIQNTFSHELPQEDHRILSTASFFLRRDSIGYADFTVSLTRSAPDYTFIYGGWIQRWRLIDPGTYLLKKQLERRQSLGTAINERPDNS